MDWKEFLASPELKSKLKTSNGRFPQRRVNKMDARFSFNSSALTEALGGGPAIALGHSRAPSHNSPETLDSLVGSLLDKWLPVAQGSSPSNSPSHRPNVPGYKPISGA